MSTEKKKTKQKKKIRRRVHDNVSDTKQPKWNNWIDRKADFIICIRYL